MRKFLSGHAGRWTRYALAVGAVAAAAAVEVGLHAAGKTAYTPFYIAVVLAALVGVGPGLLAVGLGALLVPLFMADLGRFSLAQPEDWALWCIFVVSSTIIVLVCREMRRARGRADESASRLRVIADALPVLVAYVDRDWRYRFANIAYSKWFQRPVSDIVGRHVREVIGDSAFEQVRPQLERALAGEEIYFATWLEYPSGRREVEVRYTPVRARSDDQDDGGAGGGGGGGSEGDADPADSTVTGIAAMIIDVTDRAAAERDRARLLDAERGARSEADRANRLKDQFIATVSHELRTPLQAILGWSRILLMRTGGAGVNVEEVRRGLETIDRNARAQSRLIDDLLDTSRILAGKIRIDPQPVDLRRVVDAAVEAVLPSAQARQVDLSRSATAGGDGGVVEVIGDAARLHQVVSNLLTNAVKFTPEGGSVRVSLDRDAASGIARLAVRDTGRGIEPEFLPHLFERFRQQEPSGPASQREAGGGGGGLGLGLSIVKGLVELHGGRVTAASEGPDRGATFTVTLPLSPRSSPPPIAADPTTGDAGAGGGTADDAIGVAGSPSAAFPQSERRPWHVVDLTGVRVLLLDDEDDARDLAARILADRGAEVRAFSAADDAEHAARAAPPDVILSDISMPGRDGYAFMRALRAAGVTAPAAAVTAFTRPDDRRAALAAGYQLHVGKPIDPAALVSVVAELASRSAPSAPPPPREFAPAST